MNLSKKKTLGVGTIGGLGDLKGTQKQKSGTPTTGISPRHQPSQNTVVGGGAVILGVEKKKVKGGNTEGTKEKKEKVTSASTESKGEF